MQNQTRIPELDFIRGVAVLGILFMNIHIMTANMAAYINPDYDGAASAMDKLVFSFEYLFFNSKFMAIFSLLFGVGICLLSERLEHGGLDANAFLKRRLSWLALFGLCHGIFIWEGDILFSYAICGLLLHRQRRHSPTRLFVRGLVFIAISLVSMGLIWLALAFIPEFQSADTYAFYQPSPDELALDIQNIQTRTYWQSLPEQFSLWLEILYMLPLFTLWWSGGLMLIGMGLYKSGFFVTPKSPITYTVFGVLGLLCAAIGLNAYWQNDFMQHADAYSPLLPLSGVLLGMFYLALLKPLANADTAVTRLLQQAGKMAFSLYLLQSLVVVGLFRWLMPQWYGQLEELDMLLLALGFSAVQLLIARFWLSHFRQGPMEWLWRRLTYKGAMD